VTTEKLFSVLSSSSIDFLIGGMVGAIWERVALGDPNGPPDVPGFRPVYGVGAMCAGNLITGWKDYPKACILAAIVEEIGGRISDSIGSNCPWDYSERPDSITKHVRLSYTLLFGLVMTMYATVPRSKRAFVLVAAYLVARLYKRYSGTLSRLNVQW
jgi:uncharacterized membrane protein